MRKEKDNHEPNIELLLRETAAQENDALPLEDWKRQILHKIETGQTQQEPPAVDELAARRRKNLRKITIGFSTVAAAVLILLGTSQYWQGGMNAKSAPQQDIRMATEAAPYDAAPSEAALPEALYAAPEAPAALEAPAAEAPAATGPEAPAAPAPSSAFADNAAGTGEAGIMSGTAALTPEQQKAIDALNAALPKERGKVDPATAVVVQLEVVTLKVRPLFGEEVQEMTRALVFQIEVGADTGEMISYAVDAETYEVLGEVVEG